MGDSSFVALEQAVQAGRKGDRQKMLERAEHAATLDPDNGEARALLARAYFRMADESPGGGARDASGKDDPLVHAVEHAEAAVRLDAADPEIFDRLADAHATLATRAERSGDAEGALRERGLERQALEAWAERYKQDVAWRQLADLARELGDSAGEAQALEELVRGGDDALLAAQRLGDVLSDLGRCEVAIPVLQDALDASADDKYAGISLAVQLGDCAARASEPALSETAFRKALELDPTNLIAVSGLAEALWEQGRTQEAISELDRSRDRLRDDAASGDHPAGPDTDQRLDWLATRARWKAAHDLPDALDDAKKALALASSTGTARQRALMGALVAEAHLGRGELDEGLAAAREAVRQDPTHEPSLITLLNAAWARGDRAAVGSEVAELEKKSPSSPWYRRLARWESARGFDEAARRHAKKALESFEGAPAARAELGVDVGQTLLLAGDAPDAEKLARDSWRLRPWDDDAAFLLADALVELGRGAEADDVLTQHVNARGEDPWLLERWSGYEQSRRRPTEAIAKADRALKLLDEAPSHPSARARLETRLGEAQVAAKQDAAAVETLQTAVDRSAIPPADRVVTLSQALEKTKGAAAALAVVEPALARAPQDDGLLAEKGRLLLKLGRKDEGVAVMKALLADPRTLPARHGQVAMALVEGGAADEGLAIASAAIATWPRHAALELAAARASESAGRRDEAEARFRKALELDPDSPVALNALGYSLAEWNVKLDESVKLLRRAVQLRPDEAAYLDSLGWALFRAGKLEEAAKMLEAGLARDRDPVILGHLGLLRRAQGRIPEAVSLLDEALSAGLDEDEVEARRALDELRPAKKGTP